MSDLLRQHRVRAGEDVHPRPRRRPARCASFRGQAARERGRRGHQGEEPDPPRTAFWDQREAADQQAQSGCGGARPGRSPLRPPSGPQRSAEQRRLARKLHPDNHSSPGQDISHTSRPQRSALPDLGLSDLGRFSLIMITKVPGALWTIAFVMILVVSGWWLRRELNRRPLRPELRVQVNNTPGQGHSCTSDVLRRQCPRRLTASDRT